MVDFESKSTTGTTFYHTNVVLSVGDEYAVIASYTIPEKERESVLEKLRQDRTVIELTPKQTEEEFCGNILQVKSKTSGKKVLIMSKTAWEGFTEDQKNFFKQEN